MMTATSTELIAALPDHLRERARCLSSSQRPVDGDFVLYWMRTAVRSDENPALDTAIALANRLGQTVLVYHALSERYPYASDRHHTFILQAARDVQQQFADSPVQYAFHLERPGHRGPHLRTLSDRASVVVTEEMPVAPLRQWTKLLAIQVATPVLPVDTACVVPMQLVGKPYERAFAFRNATKKLRSQRIDRRSQPISLRPAKELDWDHILPFTPVDLVAADLANLVAQCDIDHSIAPVLDTRGGSSAGYARWNAFQETRLQQYAKRRNNALLDGVSRMSAYLHYGMVSPMRLARESANIRNAGAEKYLDELLIWRELAYAFCFYRPDHSRMSALPDWAIETLDKHAQDTRSANLSWETLARGCTQDALWDAAQTSLLIHGELHNNVRMTWGKALLDWTPDAKTALKMLIDLNHRYALDGRDPASYGGILWCLGQFDRPFEPPQPVLGTVRGRPTETHAERLDVTAFASHTSRPRAAPPSASPPPTVAVIGGGISGLICARTLSDHGIPVTVFEKSRGLGGRMATRRTSQGFQFDHGAQYFTVRNPLLQRHVRSWQHDGIVRAWDGEIVVLQGGQIKERKSNPERQNTHQRFVATPGMNAICKHLASGLDVRLNTQVEQISRVEQQWELTQTQRTDARPAEGQPVELGRFDSVIVSAPATQAAALLRPISELANLAQSAQTQSCWALMLAFSESLELDFDAAFVHDAPISWISNNTSKPDRQASAHQLGCAESWVVHASPDWSDANLERPPEEIQTELTSAFWAAVACTERPTLYATAHRWRYAIPSQPLDETCLFSPHQMIGACGDWCGGPRVEGAFLSGVALAGRILAASGKVP